MARISRVLFTFLCFQISQFLLSRDSFFLDSRADVSHGRAWRRFLDFLFISFDYMFVKT